jgi:hypothetical protein
METKQNLSALAAGARVCVIGYGTANIVHRHETVHHVTRTQVITQTDSGMTSKYHRADGRSMPYQPYGGTSIHLTCQKGHKMKGHG